MLLVQSCVYPKTGKIIPVYLDIILLVLRPGWAISNFGYLLNIPQIILGSTVLLPPDYKSHSVSSIDQQRYWWG